MGTFGNTHTTIRTRGPLEMRSTGLYHHGTYVAGLGLTSQSSLLVLQTSEEETGKHYVHAGDILYLFTGLEQVQAAQKELWWSTFLLIRHHLSEIVHLYDDGDVVLQSGECFTSKGDALCPMYLALYLTEDAEPFCEAMEQASELLHYLARFPVQYTEDAHVFAATLIVMDRLDTLLARFDEQQLVPFVSRIRGGKAFMSALDRAKTTSTSLFASIFPSEKQIHVSPVHPPHRYLEHKRLFVPLTLALFGIVLAKWWLDKQHVAVSLEFRWYDLWKGVYIRPHKTDERTQHLYWCPIWCVAIHVEWPL